jgi:hypothetical protein
MTDSMYLHASPELARHRRELTPTQQAAFDAFGKAVFADGALSSKMKQIVAVASRISPNARIASRGIPRRRIALGRRRRN